MAIRKLSDVFAGHAETLIEMAINGKPFAVLVSDSDWPWSLSALSFGTIEEANSWLDTLSAQDVKAAAVAEIDSWASEPALACQLHIRPAITYGSFP